METFPETTENVKDPLETILEMNGVVSRENDSNFAEELIEKKTHIREKYQLPDRSGYSTGEKPLSSYVDALVELAAANGVVLKGDVETYRVSKGLPNSVTGVYDNDRGANCIHLPTGFFEKMSSKDFAPADVKNIKVLEHELVHALQYKEHPEMPIQQKEFEAYMAADALDDILRNPSMRAFLFGMIQSSCDHYIPDEV